MTGQRAYNVRPAPSLHVPMLDNRAHKRYLFRWPVALVFNHGEQRTTYHGTTRELSMGGCSLLTDYNIYSNQPLTMLISLPADNPLARRKVLEIRVRMRYTILAAKEDRFRCGIEFISFKDDGRNALRQAMESRIPGGAAELG